MLNVSEYAQREVTPALRWRELIAEAVELWLLRKTHNVLSPLTEGRQPHPVWPAPAVHAFSPNSRGGCVCVRACTHVCMHAQLCPTLCDTMDCSLPGSSVHGIL